MISIIEKAFVRFILDIGMFDYIHYEYVVGSDFYIFCISYYFYITMANYTFEYVVLLLIFIR